MDLFFRNNLIGQIEDVFETDGTWFGDFKPTSGTNSSKNVSRALEFIEFCKAWNASQCSSEPRQADEFDKYSDVLESGSWTIADSLGATTQIEDAPNFADDNEVSWVQQPTPPPPSAPL